MKKIMNNCLHLSLMAFLSLIIAFKVGEQVELESFLNARTEAKFMKNVHNIGVKLSKGTRGSVIATEKMPSGNYGIKIKIETGTHRGESYWVYYNLRSPLIKLLDKKNKVQNGENILKAKTAELTADQKSYREPDEKIVADTAIMATKILDPKNVSQISNILIPPDCSSTISPLNNISSEDQYKETDLVEPFREIASSPLQSTISNDTDFGWSQSKSETGKIEGFALTNNGPNNIVKSDEYFINRMMSFEYEDRARSDMKLVITDSPDGTTSHATYSIMMFFPRSVLPAIKKIGNELEVTLPNKEIVRYNANTREIIGGVFTEGPMAQNSKNKALPANIKYTGNGVMIRADKSGDLPYGDIETKGGAKAPSVSIALISKKGFKDCKIPSKDLWYTDYKKGGNTFIKPELANDQGMDQFVKAKCGFSLY